MNNNTELILAQLMLPNQANLSGDIHGGEIMKLMDNTAGACAIRYAKKRVVTARVDQLEFLKPIRVANYVTCRAKVAYVGRTSIEVFLTVDVEDLKTSDGSFRALEAFFTLVAVDSDGIPSPVPPYTPTTEEEVDLYNQVASRRRLQEQHHAEMKRQSAAVCPQ
ncbi:MAG: acyl-CoA thioesterase [Clostridiales Family XIII bacterium]|jgi:acyl-CoA hydrolase|nr:acyl-CoA thioesterase [Clostridiales Family XIII bacterium]